VQLAIAQAACVAGLTLEDQRRLMAALRQMNVEAVVRHIQAPVGKPTVVGSARVVERLRKGRVPYELAPGKIRPEAEVIAGSFFI
jgi:hypothetical protein